MALSPTAWTYESTGLTYAEWLQAKSPQVRAGGWTHATHDQVTEGFDKDGRRFKTVKDQLGNDVIQHGRDQQSVVARPQTVTAQIPASALKRELPDVQQR